MDVRRRKAVDRVVGTDGVCTAAIPVIRGRPTPLQITLFIMVMVALEYTPLPVWIIGDLVLLPAALVIGEVKIDHFLVGSLPDRLVVARLARFSRRPSGIAAEVALPADIRLESRFTTYDVTIDGVTYKAAGRTYPDWLAIIEMTGLAMSSPVPRPRAHRPRTLDVATRISAPILMVSMYAVLIITNPPWMENIDRAWFVQPATGVAMIGWLASAVISAAGWKEGLLVGVGATVFAIIAWWGDTLHGYVSFTTPFYATQIAVIVAYGSAMTAMYFRSTKDPAALAES